MSNPVISNSYVGDGSTVLYSFTFPYIETSDLRVSLDGVETTAYILANATTVQLNVAPASGVAVKVFRITATTDLKSVFFPGSAVRARDLNDNFTQSLFTVQEARNVADTADTQSAAAQSSALIANQQSTTAAASAATATAQATASAASAASALQASQQASADATAASNSAAVSASESAQATSDATAAGVLATAADVKADSAILTANNSDSNSTAALSAANAANSQSVLAQNDASSALGISQTANTASANAVNVSNTSLTNSTQAIGTSTTAASDAAAAVLTANSASSDASNSLTISNTAATDAANALTAATASVVTANAADANATTSLTNSRESDGSGGFTSAISKANTAITTANAASSAVSNAVLFTLISNVAAIPGSPSNNDYIEIGNSTGIESFSPLSGLPSGFVGATGLTVRLTYSTSGSSWVFMSYFANDSEDRYLTRNIPVVTGDSTNGSGQITLNCENNSHGVKLKGPPHSAAANYTLTLPINTGSSGQALITNGSGVTSWSTTIAGRNIFSDGAKLDGIETAATADQTKADIDALNINADLLDGQHGAYYTGYTDTAVANIVDSSPATLNTLNELAAALGDDPNFATTTANSIGTKLPLAGGTLTGGLTGTTATFAGFVDFTRPASDGFGYLAIGPGGTNEKASFVNRSGEIDLELYSNYSSSPTVSINSNGNAHFAGRLLLGTTTEGFATFGDNLTIADSGHCGVTIRSGTSSQGNIYFSDGSSGGSEEYEGIIQYLHDVNAMAFGVNNGVESMRIFSSGNVGIGTSSANAKLHIAEASTDTGGDINASADGLVVDNSGGNTGLTFKTPNTASSRICFGDPEDNNAGQILYNHSDNSLAIDTSGSERMRITSAGSMDLNGSATFAGTVSDSIGPLRRLGVHAHASSSYTLEVGDTGKIVREATSGATLTIIQNRFTAGDMITIFNVSSGNITIAQGSGTTIYNTADAATGNRTIAAKGMATIVCTTSNEFAISGSQLT